MRQEDITFAKHWDRMKPVFVHFFMVYFQTRPLHYTNNQHTLMQNVKLRGVHTALKLDPCWCLFQKSYWLIFRNPFKLFLLHSGDFWSLIMNGSSAFTDHYHYRYQIRVWFVLTYNWIWHLETNSVFFATWKLIVKENTPTFCIHVWKLLPSTLRDSELRECWYCVINA